MRPGGSPQALERHRQGTADTPLLVTYGAPRLPPTGSTAGSALSPTFTYGARRLPPTGSTAGSALSPTPPQGGSDSGAPYASLEITPPLRGSRRSRAVRRRLMRWGDSRQAPKRRLMRWGANQRLVHRLQHIHTVLKHLVVPKAQYSIPLPPKIIIALLVVGVPFRVLAAVQFDHQFSGHAGEIYDIGTYRLLTPELVTVQLFSAQVVP